jgi:hypothetical protein
LGTFFYGQPSYIDRLTQSRPLQNKVSLGNYLLCVLLYTKLSATGLHSVEWQDYGLQRISKEEVVAYSSLLALQHCVGLDPLHASVPLHFSVRGSLISCPTSELHNQGQYFCLALPGAYAPVSIALRVTATLRAPLHDKTAVLDEVNIDTIPTFNCRDWETTKLLCEDSR